MATNDFILQQVQSDGSFKAFTWSATASTTNVVNPIYFPAGTATAGTAPIYLQSGVLLSAPVIGAIEFLTDKLYTTITTGTARKELAMWDAAGTPGRIPFETTNGRLVDSGNLTYTAATGLQVVAGATTAVPVIAKGAASQTADLIQAQDSSANVLAKVDVNGSGYFSGSGQSIIQLGATINQAQDSTSAGVFNVKGQTDTSLIITDNVNNRVGIGTAAPTKKLGVSGDISLETAGNRLYIKEGTNGMVGQTTLVAGTIAITISGVTTSSRAFVTLVTPNTTTLTTTYQAVCTANTLTIQANIAAGTINIADVSTLNYLVIN